MRTKLEWWKVQLVVSLAMFLGGSAGLGWMYAQEQPGRLVVDTTPESLIHVDSTDTDLMTPLSDADALVLAPGEHVLTLITPTFQVYRYSVTVKPGDNRFVTTLGSAPTQGEGRLLAGPLTLSLSDFPHPAH